MGILLASYPYEYIMFNTIHTLRDSFRLQADLIIQVHIDRLSATLRKIPNWYTTQFQEVPLTEF